MLKGHVKGQIIADRRVSGTTPICDRPSWLRMAESGVGKEIVKNCKRFARSVLVQENGIAWADAHGIKVIALDRPSTFTDRTRRGIMVRQIEAAITEAEKGELVDNLSRGRLQALRNNGKKQSYLTLAGKGKCSGRKSLLQTSGPQLARGIKGVLKRPYAKRQRKNNNKLMSWSQLVDHLAQKGFRPRGQKHKVLDRSAVASLLADMDNQGF